MNVAQITDTELLKENQSLIEDRLRLLGNAPRSIELEAGDLKSMWIAGIFNDTAYVALILKLEGKKWHSAKDFKFDEFIIEWQACEEDDNGNPVRFKTLKVKAIRDAIDKLVKAEIAEVQTQLSLQITW
jgi:hypothetical protein